MHFSTTGPGQVAISGMRSDCNVAIFLNLAKAVDAGLVLYICDNDVIITEGEGVEGVLISSE